MPHRSPLLALFFVVSVATVGWPQADTVLSLAPVQVRELRLKQATVGQRTEALDSVPWAATGQTRLDDLLAGHLNIHLKDYGPGRLTTTTVRGANASQTAVLWNGVPLQSPMLGQTDLSLIPLFFFDRVGVQYGAGSALWGSGAMGGAVQLETVAPQAPGVRVAAQATLGSFGRWAQHLRVGWGRARWSATLRAHHDRSTNDFPYTDLLGQRRRTPHAAIRQYGLMPSLYADLGRGQSLDAHLWWQDSRRQLPPTRVQPRSVAVQDDRARRATLRWQRRTARTLWQVRAAHLDETLRYTDSIARIDSDSRAHTLLAEAEVAHHTARGHRWMGGVGYTHTHALSNNYMDVPRQSRPALWAAWQWDGPQGRRLSVSLRQEATDGRWWPPAPALDWQWPIGPAWLVRGQLGGSFRLPTFNDLYWRPGGRPDLRPERALGGELGLYGQWVRPTWVLRPSATLYSRTTHDYILWVPAGNVFSPENVRQVWSRGLEVRLAAQGQVRGWQWHTQWAYDLTHATNQRALGTGGAGLVGRQLIYVPVHQGMASVRLSRGRWGGHYTHRTGSRAFILADNTDWLPAYHTANAGLNMSAKWRGRIVTFGFTAFNLWDADYELVRNFPLPGRYFAFSVLRA